jgi:hypothetical protein
MCIALDHSASQVMDPCFLVHQPRKWAYIMAYSDTHNTLEWLQWQQCCCTYAHCVTLLSTTKLDIFCHSLLLSAMFYLVQVIKHLFTTPSSFSDTCVLIWIEQVPCQCVLSSACCILKLLEKESFLLNPESYKHMVRWRMLKIVRPKETSQIAVVTGSKWNKWGQSEQYKTWNQQAF